ncbi:Tad domain-containing protein [Geomonas sp. Red32]|nr:Tad domain-containing protein [Geomonas sp. Red32]
MALVFVAISLVVLLGFLGLAVDTARLFKVRNELQNAADAAALKGGWYLYTRPTAPGSSPTLQWSVALAKAQELANSSDNQALANATASVGYWNLLWDNTQPHDLQPTTMIPTTNDVPAVKVAVGKSGANNGGPVTSFFMQLFGKASVPVDSLPAVAISGHPGTIAAGNLFPLALSNCMTNQYFAQSPLPEPPTTIVINSAYSSGGSSCYSGQWTSFQTNANDVSTIQGFINSGNSSPIETGDSIWIEPGVKNSIYNYVSGWLPSGGKDVLMAVVDNSTNNLSSKGEIAVTGFATFHIDGANNGSNPNVFGHFVDFSVTAPGSRPGGGSSNSVTLPILVQ